MKPAEPEPVKCGVEVLLLKRDLIAVVGALRGVCALTGDECFRDNAEAWERADRALREYERGGEP